MSFYLSLMFAGKAAAHMSEAPFGYPTLGLAPGLTLKHYTRLERLAREQHYRLLQKLLNYGHKKFYECQWYKTFFFRNLQMFVISWSVCRWQAFPA
jgi:hypothetical protein